MEVPGEGRNAWVRRYSSAGGVDWTRTYNGPSNGADQASGVTVGPDGKVYSAADFGEYKINVWQKDGTLSHVINREWATHERSDEQSERILEIYKGFTRQIPIPNMQYEIQPNWNPIQTINARDDGTLWVQTSRDP